MSAMAVPTVLTVEDDPIIRADLRLVLEGAGFEVSAAQDGIQAVEMAREDEPDAILIDLSLPRLDGLEATRQILAERVVPIVALTGLSRDLAEQAVEAGAASYVLKPFHPEEVVGALLTAISDHAESGRVRSARDESRSALSELVTLLGYPESWGHTLEEQAFRSGRLWRRSS